MTKRRKKRASAGLGYMFHGAFTSLAAADRRAKKRKGFVLKRTLPGRGRRYIVMTERAPF
jgi:hypothetical protein